MADLQVILLADLQPDANSNGPDQWITCKQIISEIPIYFSQANHMIFAGDIVDRGHPSSTEQASDTAPFVRFSDMKEELDATGLIYETIPGNHDHDYRPWFRPRTGEANNNVSLWEYRKVFGATQKIFDVGNIRFLMMGDEESNTAGVISPATHAWWLDEMARASQENMSVITVTHQSLEGTVNADSSWVNKDFDTSPLFDSSLANGIKPDAWLCGHHGSRQNDEPNERHVFYRGIPFVNVGTHLPSILEASSIREAFYKVLEVDVGSSVATIKTWSHDDKSMQNNFEFSFNLSNAFQV